MLIPRWLVRAVVTGGLSGSSAAFQGCSNYWRTLEQPTRAQPGPAQPGQADTEIWKYRKMTNCPTEQRNVSNVSTPLPHPRNEYSKVQPLECRPTPLSSPRQEQKCTARICFNYCKHFLLKFSRKINNSRRPGTCPLLLFLSVACCLSANTGRSLVGPHISIIV